MKHLLRLIYYTVIGLATVPVVSQAQTIPDDFNGEPAFPSHAYWENHGQIIDTEGNVVEDLRYYTMGTGPKLFIFDDKVSFAHYFTDSILADTSWRMDMRFVCNPDEYPDDPSPGEDSDAEPSAEPCGTLSALEETTGKLNFYLPHTGAGLVGLLGYHRVVYQDVWPGIDYHFYSNRIGLKIYIVVHPGADPNDILMKFSGQDQITTPAPGDVRMHLANRTMKLPQAFAWQYVSGTPTPLPWLPSWNLTGSNDDMVNVSTGSYNTNEMLVIQLGGDTSIQGLETDDPNDNSDWSTYLGDNLTDFASGVDIDEDGDLYVCGGTRSAYFPTAEGQQIISTNGETDVFVAKFDHSTREHLWTTIVGGEEDDLAESIDYNGVDKVYVVGASTSSTMIPPLFSNQGNYVQTHQGNYDGFIIKLRDGTGEAEWITDFGGNEEDWFFDVTATEDDVFIAGRTRTSNSSQTCISPGSGQIALCDPGGSSYFQSTHGGGFWQSDALMVRFNSSGDLTYSTYLGGFGVDEAHAIGIDNDNRIVIGGYTETTNIPSNVTSPCGVPSTGEFPLCDYGANSYYQDANPSSFIVRLDQDLQLEWGTFFGEDARYNKVSDLAFNSLNDLVVVGNARLNTYTINTCTASTTNAFPVCASGLEYKETYHFHDQDPYRENTYIARFDEQANLEWSTPYGESSYHFGKPEIAIDDDDNMYIVSTLHFDPGGSLNEPFPGQYFPGYYQQWGVQNTSLVDKDATLVAFDVNNERQWATVFGAEEASGPMDIHRNDHGIAIAAHGTDEIVIGGSARALNLYQACPFIGTSYCQTQLSDLSEDAFVTRFSVEWLATQVEEMSTDIESIKLYPNPVKDELIIELVDGLIISDISIMSLDGRTVWSSKIIGSGYLLEVPTQQLSFGVYIINLACGDGSSYTTKFVKQ
ncbi:MAG: T9SS type A sorting domain-containing protein [Salibacteraceae bacterium]